MKKTKRLLGILLSIVLAIGLMPGTCMTVFADGGDPYYYDPVTKTTTTITSYTNVTADVASWTTGWYVVDGEVVFDSNVQTTGTVNLLLCDGAKLTANQGIAVTAGNTLNIYAQSEGDDMGELIAIGGKKDGEWVYQAGIGCRVNNTNESDGNISIYGGKITATNSHESERDFETPYGIRGWNVTIYGGSVFASGTGYAGIKGRYITINGGTVYATGGLGGISQNSQDNRITINGGNVTAIGESGSGMGIRSNGTLHINGGTVTATTNGASGTSVGVMGMYLGEDIVAVAGSSQDDAVVVSNIAQNFREKNYHWVMFQQHVHDFTYETGMGENANTIIATCHADNCYLTNHQATLTIDAPALTTFGGSGSAEVTITDAKGIHGSATVRYYSATKSGDTYTRGTELSGAPTDAGDYWAEITLGADTNTATAGVGYSIAKASTAEPADSNARTLCGIDYINETSTPASGYEVSTDGTNPETSPISLTDILDRSGSVYVYIRTAAADDNHEPSEWVRVLIESRPGRPNPSTEKASNEHSADGRIYNITSSQEYSTDGINWTDVTGYYVDGLVAGTYYFRVKATASKPRGPIATVILGCNYAALTEARKPIISVSDNHNPPIVGDTLTATTIATHLTYQWYRDGEAISGATESTYTLTADDAGKAVSVKVAQTRMENGSIYPENQRPSQTSESTASVIKKTPEPINQTTAQGGVTIAYGDETVAPKNGYDVSLDGASIGTSPMDLTEIIDGNGERKIFVRTSETGDTEAGQWVEVPIAARPSAPTGFTTTNASSGVAADGKISGADSTMEYSVDGTTWRTVTQNPITGLSSGTYVLRKKATTTSWHSAETTVQVGRDYTALTETNKPTITVEGDHNPPVVGDTLTATTTATDLSYQWFRDGEPITGVTGMNYALTADDVDKKITVQVVQTAKSDGTDYEAGQEPTQASDELPEVVKKTPDGINESTARNKATFNYEGETVTPDEGYEISTNGTSVAASPVSLTDVLDGDGTPTIYVRTKETSDTSAGAWVPVTLTKRPDAPTNLTTSNASDGKTADGKIEGTASDMEYSSDDGVTWTTAGDEETDVKPGTYLVRKKATDTRPAGKTAEVTVGNQLAENQTDAKEDLGIYRKSIDDTAYDAEGIKELNDALKAGEAAIEKATDSASVKEALKKAKEAIDAVKTKAEKDAEIPKNVNVVYATHIQNKGWEKTVKKNGEMSGTTGSALRLEGLVIKIEGDKNLGVQYAAHVQDYGWMPWAANGEIAGSTGESKRMEAVMIKLTGADQDKFDIYYRVHAQNLGWLGWSKNGEAAGTAGYGYRLEALQIQIVPKGKAIEQNAAGIKSVKSERYASKDKNLQPVVSGSDKVSVSYKTHVQHDGWQSWKSNGAVSGTYGRSLRLEGININLSNKDYTGGVRYKTHVQNIGWEKMWHTDGETAGTYGKSLRLEAIDIELYGEMAEHYDVYYRVHCQNYGWLAWAKNGENAGTSGRSYRLEGIQVVLVPKGGAAPAANYGGVITNTKQAYLPR